MEDITLSPQMIMRKLSEYEKGRHNESECKTTTTLNNLM